MILRLVCATVQGPPAACLQYPYCLAQWRAMHRERRARMGIFDFLKNAGRKVDDDDARSAKTVSEDKVRAEFEAQRSEAKEQRREAALIKLVNDMGLRPENLVVNVEGDTVTLHGVARSQEEREKLILLVGNVEGIARVDDRLTLGGQTAAAGAVPGTVHASTTSVAETQAQFYTV